MRGAVILVRTRRDIVERDREGLAWIHQQGAREIGHFDGHVAIDHIGGVASCCLRERNIVRPAADHLPRDQIASVNVHGVWGKHVPVGITAHFDHNRVSLGFRTAPRVGHHIVCRTRRRDEAIRPASEVQLRT